jgi:molybdopterin/thiamine biosynthesis adenylyltransferase
MQPLVAPVDALAPAELVRTARHAVLAGIGEEGQRRLAAASVAVVGAGGIGSPVVLALAAAGIGHLTIIDDDTVELTNLQRQVAHRAADVGAGKAESAARAATDLAPGNRVTPVRTRLDAGNAAALLAGAHVVVDGSDTFDTRRAVAGATEAAGVPLVWGTVQEFAAQATVFWSRPPAGHDPVVLDDLYPAGTTGEPPTCAEVGVLGSLCLQLGGLLASEVIKLVTGSGNPLLGRIVVIDALNARMRDVPLRAGVRA